MEEEEKIHKNNSAVSFNRRLYEAEKSKIINYIEEKSIHSASNYHGISRLTIRY